MIRNYNRYQHWSIANLQYQISNPYLDLLVEIYLLVTYLYFTCRLISVGHETKSQAKPTNKVIFSFQILFLASIDNECQGRLKAILFFSCFDNDNLI